MTPFDELVSSPQLQMIKLLLPYVPVSGRRLLAALVKFLELRRAVRVFNGPAASELGYPAEDASKPWALIENIKPYLDPKEAEMMETVMNMKDILSMAEMMQKSSGENSAFDPSDLMMGMLSPNSRKCSAHTVTYFHRHWTMRRKEMTTVDEWMNNPALKGIDPAKLELIRMAAARTRGKTGRDLAPVMLALITSANKQGIRFSPEEVSLILDILKEGKSKEEQEQIERTIRMTSSIFQKHMQ